MSASVRKASELVMYYAWYKARINLGFISCRECPLSILVSLRFRHKSELLLQSNRLALSKMIEVAEGGSRFDLIQLVPICTQLIRTVPNGACSSIV